MKFLPPIIVALSGVIFLLTGIVGLVAPADMLVKFGVSLDGPAGLNEIRAQYGGFLIAVAVFLFWCLLKREYHTALLLHTLGFLGINVGRLISLLIDGFSTFEGYTPVHQACTLWIDPGGLIIGVIGLWSLQKSKSPREQGTKSAATQ